MLSNLKRTKTIWPQGHNLTVWQPNSNVVCIPFAKSAQYTQRQWYAMRSGKGKWETCRHCNFRGISYCGCVVHLSINANKNHGAMYSMPTSQQYFLLIRYSSHYHLSQPLLQLRVIGALEPISQWRPDKILCLYLLCLHLLTLTHKASLIKIKVNSWAKMWHSSPFNLLNCLFD